VKIAHRVVRFAGTLADGYRACLWSRVASRILLPVDTVYAGSVRALYAELRKIRWLEHLGPHRTLAVHFVGTDERIRNSHFGALKVKDAIVDTIRQFAGDRPSIDTEAPDVRIHAWLHRKRVTVSLDLSGDPLHLRGLNRDGGPAPLKETLAAGILRYAGWHRHGPAGAPLVDPLCGSGTFLLEAADVLADRAPGLARPRWGFQGWKGHEPEAWEGLLAEARERVRPLPRGRLFGFDDDPDQVERARANLATIGAADAVPIERRALRDQEPPVPGREALPHGLVVTNPPYGERLGDEEAVRALWSELGDVLRRRFLGWTAWLLAGNPQLPKALGLRPKRRIELYNGPIEARLLHVPISDRPVARDR